MPQFEDVFQPLYFNLMNSPHEARALLQGSRNFSILPRYRVTLNDCIFRIGFPLFCWEILCPGFRLFITANE